jgi:putative transposase
MTFTSTTDAPRQRGPKAPAIELDAASRAALDQLLRRHSTSQQLVLRARIILDVAAGYNNCHIARRHSIALDMVRLWRERWLSFSKIPLSGLTVEERFTDASRAGRKARITSEQRCRIMALACEQPADSQRPIQSLEWHRIGC